MKNIFFLFAFILINMGFIFSQNKTISLENKSKIELKENRDDMANYLNRLINKYGEEELLIVVLFDVKNDPKSPDKFEKLVKDSILKRKNDVAIRIIMQPIPTEYKYMDVKGRDNKAMAMPTHNVYFYYKDKTYLNDFVERMKKATEKMNIWKVGFHEVDEATYGHIFERVNYGGSCLPDEEELIIKCMMPLFDPLKILESNTKRIERESKLKDTKIDSLNTENIKLKEELAQNKKISPPKGLNFNVFRSVLGFNNSSYTNAEFGFDKKKMSTKSTFYSVRINYPFLDLNQTLVLEAGLGFDYGNHSIGFDGDSPINYQIESEDYHTNVSLTEINETVNFQSTSIPVFAKINYKISDKLVLSNSLGLRYQMYRNASLERNQVFGSYSRQYDGLNFEIENIAAMGLENDAVIPVEIEPIEFKANFLIENISYFTYQINPFFGVYGYYSFITPHNLKLKSTADYLSSNPDDYNSIFRLSQSEIRTMNSSLGLGLKINF
jgi:hypothetical protein